MRPTRVVALSLSLVCLPCLAPAAGDDVARVAKNRETILSRLKRDKVAYRGDKPGEMRVKWEWWDRVVGNYLHEKRALLRELSAGEKYELREGWVYKDMKVTFQELFALGPEDDDKLVPIISHAALLAMAPRATFEGMTLLGKQGEAKGPTTRKFKERVASQFGSILADRLEYKDVKGSVKTAGGWSYDAVTLRWKDVKNRVADEVSDAKAAEDLDLERDVQYPEPGAQ